MTTNPYALSRQPVYAANGMVATSQPLAAQAGLATLMAGGNAVDAAIATAAALTVVEPTHNGIGGDAFALVWDGERLQALNGSGRAPALYRRENLPVVDGRLPTYGWPTVTVPGAPAAWAELHARLGRLPLEKIFEPAVEYARRGFPLSPMVAKYWQRARRIYTAQPGTEFKPWTETFLPDGFEPATGRMWRSEAHARTLEAIARSRGADFYSGAIAEAIDAFSRETGGLLRGDDLAAHRGDWVTPISTSYRDHEIWEIPPNTQALAALEALNILEGCDLPRHREDADGLHLQIEAMKLAFADTLAYVADPDYADVPVAGLLSRAYAAQRRAMIGDEACDPAAGTPARGDTVYLCAADRDGMMVSFIQSNYMGFGSGIVVPGTGIALHNRGHNFSLEAGHPNELQPGKRPFHTIMPGFLTHQGAPVGPFGVMGAFMQPQGHVQMAVNTLDYGLDPQAALDAPRWQWLSGRHVRVEHSMPTHVIEGLLARGHEVTVGADETGFGRGQILWRRDNGVLVAGSDCRADGQAAGF
jgi:gamma-glutamyltranspeptidase/glutathione hydrolase